jgi:hypothetical protein
MLEYRVNVDLRNGVPLDGRQVKAGLAEALAIPESQRYLGLTVFLAGSRREYWWRDGLRDSDLVEKSLGGGSSGMPELDGGYPGAVYLSEQVFDCGAP